MNEVTRDKWSQLWEGLFVLVLWLSLPATIFIVGLARGQFDMILFGGVFLAVFLPINVCSMIYHLRRINDDSYKGSPGRYWGD